MLEKDLCEGWKLTKPAQVSVAEFGFILSASVRLDLC